MPEPESITSIELSIPCGERPPLGATLSLPSRPRAAALILQGAGPHDRDGAMPAFGFRSTLYKRLAHELGTRFGIACLRYDKRGHDLPADAPRDYSLEQRFTDAYLACIPLIMREEISGLPQFVVGHSEGGVLAAGVATVWSGSNDGKIFLIAGAVSLAAPFGNVFELNRERARITADLSPSSAQRAKAASALEFYDKLRVMFDNRLSMTPNEFKAFADNYRDRGFSGWESFEWLKGHYRNELSSFLDRQDVLGKKVPTLVAQGGRDARLPEDNPKKWEDWCAARPLASYLFIPDMGHDLNDAKRKAFVLDEALLAGIGTWIDRVLKTK